MVEKIFNLEAYRVPISGWDQPNQITKELFIWPLWFLLTLTNLDYDLLDERACIH
jgi:hypothetical protein